MIKPLKLIIKNKRGEDYYSFSAYHFIIAGIIFAVMAIILIGVTQNYVASYSAHSDEVLQRVYAFRVINTCMAHQDEVTKRYYPGVIDIRKFTQQNLETCFSNTTSVFSVQLEDMENQKSLGRIMVGMGAYRRTKNYPVLIMYEDGTYSKGELLFSTR